MSFVKVKLADWDCSKVTIGKPPKGGDPNILYDGKIPILSVCGDGKLEKYVVKSFKGLQKTMVYDEGKKAYTDEWAGEWEISFKVCETVDSATPLQKKLMDLFDDVIKKVARAYGSAPKTDGISYKWTMKDNEFGISERHEIQRDKPAYMKIKVGYEAPADCEQIIVKGKKLPALEYRYPKASFYDITRARDSVKVVNPDKECQVGMNAIPEFMISVFKNHMGLFLTRRLMQCYYEPAPQGSGGPDEDLIDTLRSTMSELDIDAEY